MTSLARPAAPPGSHGHDWGPRHDSDRPAGHDGEWRIVDEPPSLDEQTIARLGNKFLVGNGYLGYRGTLEEYTRAEKVSVIVSGLYDQVGDQWREPVDLPNGGWLELEYDGRPLRAHESRVDHHAQALDLRRAIHERDTTFVPADGNRIRVRSRRFASLPRPHLVCVEYTVESDRRCSVRLHAGIDADVWDINGPHLEEIATHPAGPILAVTACTHEQGRPIAVAAGLLGAGDPVSVLREDRRIAREFDLDLEAGVPRSVVSVSAYHTGLDTGDPLAAALRSCREGIEAGFETLLAEHASLWDERWRECDVRIEGDERAQLALRFSMYHLLSIAPGHADDVSIPARGLSGQVYKGAVFWDTEIFMLPFFIHAFPSLARNLLLYRYHTLDGARRKAREYGFRGAFYAWESQDSGDDACTLFNITDVFTNRPMRTYFRDRQLHISGDVAYAMWSYFELTGDESILLDGGAEVIYECARFFMSCTYYNPAKRRYELLDVTGPDEYHERVHNNAYTNWMAGHTFEACLRLDGYLEGHHPVLARQLRDRLGLADDLGTIGDMAAALFRPSPDPSTGVIPQFDGFLSLEDVPLDTLMARKLHPYEYLGGGNGLATTTQVIKQADVILALFLLGRDVPAAVKAANWAYYEPRTEHGSSLSACSYSLVAAEIGRVEWAYDYFMRTASIDLDGESKDYVGPLYIGGTHPAANGGAWMSAVLGLCGIRCSGNTITIEPHLPEHWRRVEMPLHLQGQKVLLSLTHETASVRAARPLTADVFVRVAGVTHRLPPEGDVFVALEDKGGGA